MSTATMKAVSHAEYCTPDGVRLTETVRPALSTPDDEHRVVVRVEAAGVDQGVWHHVTGLPYVTRAMFGMRRPKVPVIGRDFAGVVEAVGSGVTRFKPGDEVLGTADAAFAEYASTVDNRLVHKPANVSFEQAATVPTSGQAALHAVRDAGNLQAGQRVLVLGAGGGVGTFAVQIAKAFGATVTGVCSTGKTELVRSLGADEVVDYTTTDVTTGAGRYDLILSTGGAYPIGSLRGILAPRGTLVIVGDEVAKGRWLQGTDRQMKAMLLSPFVGQRLKALMSLDNLDTLRVLCELIEAGKVTPVVDTVYGLAEAAQALHRLRDGHPAGKVVLRVA